MSGHVTHEKCDELLKRLVCEGVMVRPMTARHATRRSSRGVSCHDSRGNTVGFESGKRELQEVSKAWCSKHSELQVFGLRARRGRCDKHTQERACSDCGSRSHSQEFARQNGARSTNGEGIRQSRN